MGYSFRKQICAACGADDAGIVGRRAPRAYDLPSDLQVRIVRCRRCGLLYPDPMPVPDQAQREANYGDPASYFPNEAGERTAFYHWVLAGIEALCPGKGRLLDIGCGRGELLMAARERGWQATGVEPSPRFAQEARRGFDGEVICAEPGSANLPEGGFDAAAMVSVLHHAQDPRDLLEAARRALKPGGTLFIETMNHESLVYRIPDLVHRFRGSGLTTHLSPTFPSYELYGFSRKPLERILKDGGFDLEKIEIRGGVSKTRVAPRGARDWVLRLGLKAVMLAAKALGGGQVLVALARRRA